MRRNKQVLNQAVNFFWAILCFSPLVWYWISFGSLDSWFYGVLIISLLFGFFPDHVFIGLQVSRSRKIYELLGVKFIRKFVQGGNLFVRYSKETDKRARITNSKQAKKYLHILAVYERFHWICFLFFLGTSLHAFAKGSWCFGLIICFLNLLFNLSSILLQQYNRLRISRMYNE